MESVNLLKSMGASPCTNPIVTDEGHPACLLCGHTETILQHRDRFRPYFRCRICGLVFVPPAYHLNLETERARYRLHQNRFDQPGYRRFLRRIMTPLLPELQPGFQGLDFGAGESGVLAELLTQAGFPTVGYDPFFAPQRQRLTRTYDFVTCTEVCEHLRQPLADFQQMLRLVRPGGWLAVMTQLTDAVDDFTGWHYLSDQTHIGFYGIATFNWIADFLQRPVRFAADSVMLFQG